MPSTTPILRPEHAMDTISHRDLDAALAAARAADAGALARMLRAAEAEVCWAALLELTWRAPEPGGEVDEALGAIQARLPAEAHDALLEVASWRSARLDALPEWRRWGLDPRQEAGWRALELARDPERADALAEEAGGATAHLSHLVRHPDAILTAHPGLPAALAASPYASHATVGMRLLEPGMACGAVSLDVALETLRAALGHDHRGVVCDALEHLAQPWAAWAWRDDAHATLLRFARQPDRYAAQHAIRALTARGAHDPLSLLARDEALGVAERGLALVGLAGCPDAGARDVEAILSIAREVPEGFGSQALDALSALHARAVFVTADQVADVLTLYDVCDVPAGQVATLLYTCREAARDALLALPFDDTRWRRRVEVLARLEGGAPSLLDVARGGGCAAARALVWAGTQQVEGTKALALELLEDHPPEAVSALHHTGTQATCDALAAAVGLDSPDGHVATHLRSVHERAVGLVWHLDEDRRWRDALLSRLNPARLPYSIQRDLGGGISRGEMELLVRMNAEHEETLKRLCAHGDAQAHDTIVELLRWAVWSTANRRLEPIHEHGRGAPRLAETALSEELLSALRQWGERMHDRGALRPHVLVGAYSRDEAGRRVMNHLLFAALEGDVYVPPQVLRVALDALDGQLDTHQIRIAVKHLRHEDPDVRKVALRALAACEEDPGTLVRFVTMLRAEDIETTRAALEALDASPYGAFVPLEFVSRVIERPNMNLKRLAARYIARRSDDESCPLEVMDKALFWLGHHDHSAFRASLFGVLERGLGDGTHAVVAHAINRAREAGEGRRVELLGALIARDEPKRTRWRAPARHIHDMANPFEGRTPAEALTHIATHAGGAREAVKAELVSRVRALETIPLLAKPLRLEALRACGARVTIDDLVACLRDADRSNDPAAMTTALLNAFVDGIRGWPAPSSEVREELAAALYAVGDAERRRQLVSIWRTYGMDIDSSLNYYTPPDEPLVVESLWRDLSADAAPGTRSVAIGTAASLPWAPALHAEALRVHVVEGVPLHHANPKELVAKVEDEDLERLLGEVSTVKETTRAIDVVGQDERALPWLVDVWTHAHPTLSRRALAALALHPAERRFMLLRGRVEGGEHGLVRALGSPLLDGPEVDRLMERVSGSDAIHLGGITVSGALVSTTERARRRDEHERFKAQVWDVVAPTHQRQNALGQLDSDDVFEVLGALRVLSRHRDAEVEAAVLALGDHPEARVRDAARRALRRLGSRAAYIDATFAQLDDPRPDTRRAAIRALAHARHAPALGAIVDAAFDRHAGLRRAARDALGLFGAQGERALMERARRARPDVRRALVALRDELFGS